MTEPVSALELFQELLGSENPNTTKRMQHKQISVSANDAISAATNRELQEFVIFRVTAIRDRLGDLRKFSLLDQSG